VRDASEPSDRVMKGSTREVSASLSVDISTSVSSLLNSEGTVERNLLGAQTLGPSMLLVWIQCVRGREWKKWN
jgi:hypothetical protein